MTTAPTIKARDLTPGASVTHEGRTRTVREPIDIDEKKCAVWVLWDLGYSKLWTEQTLRIATPAE